MFISKATMADASNPMRAALEACRAHLVRAGAFSAVINLLYIAPTIYMLQVYDRVLPTRGVGTLAFLTFLLLASLATLSLLDLVRSRLLVRASARLERTLSGRLLSASLERGVASRLSQPMREFDALRQTVTGAGVLALFDAPWTVVYIALCFLLHPLLGLMAVVGSGALVALTLATERATRGKLGTANEAAAFSYVAQAQTAALADTVRALGMREAVVQRHQRERAAMIGLQAQASFAAGRYMSLTKFLRLSLQSLGLGLAAYLAIGQSISAGAIFAASLLLSRALSPIEQVLGSWRQLEEARNAYVRLSALLAGQEADVEKTRLPAPAGRVQVEEVTVGGAAPDRPILSNVSFTLAPGEVLGVVGMSGAGKSTLIRALVGAVKAERGVVRFDGASIEDWDGDLLGRHIGYMPQEIGLLQGTVKQNISRFQSGEDIDGQVIAAAQACGAHEMILRLAKGYDTVLDWGGRGVSHGQGQRIALARALYGEPAIVALDEPNAHLDADGEQTLLNAIHALKARGAAVVIVAHRASMLDAMDRLLVLADGRVTQVGRRDDVLKALQGAPPPPARLQEREVA